MVDFEIFQFIENSSNFSFDVNIKTNRISSKMYVNTY